MPSQHHSLSGIFAAALTPLKADFTPDLEAIPPLLRFLAQRGCHGSLLLGTTGEGPSFAPEERLAICQSALQIRQELPGFRLLAGTGTPSLDETILLTRSAFDLGLDGVVVLPPYYFRNVSADGLFSWFSQVIRRAVPADGLLYGYHIPPITGVGFSLDLLARLKETYPRQFAGIKDSSGDADFARQLGERFGNYLSVFNGNDRLFSLALQSGASGCITAMANYLSPSLRQVWDAFQNGKPDARVQEYLSAARGIMDRYPPAPALYKALLARRHAFPRWAVRPPLLALPDERVEQAFAEIDALS